MKNSKQALTKQITALENNCKALDTVSAIASVATKLRLSSLIIEALETISEEENLKNIDDEEYKKISKKTKEELLTSVE